MAETRLGTQPTNTTLNHYELALEQGTISNNNLTKDVWLMKEATDENLEIFEVTLEHVCRDKRQNQKRPGEHFGGHSSIQEFGSRSSSMHNTQSLLGEGAFQIIKIPLVPT